MHFSKMVPPDFNLPVSIQRLCQRALKPKSFVTHLSALQLAATFPSSDLGFCWIGHGWKLSRRKWSWWRSSGITKFYVDQS